jgi:hypothetical protein
MVLAVDLVRRFLPEADQSTLMMAAVWLVGQCSIFVRSREQLANPSVSLAMDAATIERLTRLVSTWALAGLARRHNCTQKRPGLSGRRPRRSSLIKTLGLTLMSCRASRPNQGTIHSEALREKAASAGATFTLGATRQGRLRLDLSNDLPRFEKNSQQCRP